MQPILVLIPLAIVIVTVLFGIGHSFLRTWFDYRLKLTFLEKLEKHPEFLQSDKDVDSVLGSIEGDPVPTRQDYVLTGLLLAGIGILCVLFGRGLRVGELAVGTYLGGFFCVVVGLLLAGLGALLRFIAKDPTAALKRQ